MRARELALTRQLAQRLAEAEATIEALLSGQIDAVVDAKSMTPVLLAAAHDALRDSEERHRRIVETANEGILTLDTEARITFVNPRFGEMLGYRADEMLGKRLFQFLPPASHEPAAGRLQSSSEGVSHEAQSRLMRRDGTEMAALLKTSPIRDSNGTYVGILAMVTDWTRYQQAEDALRKSEEQYRQIVETTSDGIMKSTGGGLILFVNRRFAEMLGYEPRELIGASMFDFMSPAAKVIAKEAFERRSRGIQDVVDTTFRHRDGTDIAVNIAGSPLFDEARRYVGNLGVIRDITEQRKLQAALMISDRMASVGTLAAGVAHEINNPLAAVIANLDYIADCRGQTGAAEGVSGRAVRSDAWFREEIRECLDDAREAAQQVRFIVRDLKIFSRSPDEEPRGTVNVEAVMESSLRMAWNEIRHRARLVKDYARVPGIDANESRLGQVFLNLLVNAAQALQEGGADHNQIRVSTRLVGDRVVVEVSDTGCGIPPEVIGRIFDAFFTTKPVGVGTGLGLAICLRIVTDMRGELTVVSAVGKGTTFRVALPVARTVEHEPATPLPQAPAPGRRGRILVVDDEELVLRSVKRTLAKEHEVVTMADAREALALCAGGKPFDLILCDLMMPHMTGMAFYGELVRVAPEQASRMIFLTGGAFTPAARSFLSEAPKEHLEKPFDPANLRAIVQRYLR